MDPISHAVIGSAVAALAPAGTHPAVIWGIILGAEIPDSDLVLRYVKGEAAYLKNHRGPTHGLAVLPLHAAVIAGLLHLIWPAAPFGSLFGWTLLGCLSHVLFDFGNDYGTMGLWPFSRKKIARDIIPIIDLRLLLLIGGGWLLTAIWPDQRQWLFAAVWLLIGLYAGLRVWLRSRAVALVRAKLHVSLAEPVGEAAPPGEGWEAERVSVVPTLLSLNAWRYVVQMPGEYWTGFAYLRQGRISQPQRRPNQMNAAVRASLQSPLIALFAAWSRKPRAEVIEQEGRTQVVWSDARYEYDGVSPFQVRLWLDDRLQPGSGGFDRPAVSTVGREAIRRRLRLEMGREEA